MHLILADDSPVAIYPPLMVQLGRENQSSLGVSFLHLSNACAVLAVWIADEPEKMLEIFDEEATSVMFSVYPEYSSILSAGEVVHVRITSLPIVDKLSHLRQSHLNCLVRVEGVVTRRSGVFPQLQLVTFNCIKCRAVTGPYTQNSPTEARPSRCPECQSPGPFRINYTGTIYRNYQKITLQEAPGSVPVGRVPRQKDVVLLHDLINSVSLGEMVDVTAVYKHTFDPSLNSKKGFPVFSTVLQANYVQKHASAMTSTRLIDQDKEAVSPPARHAHSGSATTAMLQQCQRNSTTPPPFSRYGASISPDCEHLHSQEQAYWFNPRSSSRPPFLSTPPVSCALSIFAHPSRFFSRCLLLASPLFISCNCRGVRTSPSRS